MAAIATGSPVNIGFAYASMAFTTTLVRSARDDWLVNDALSTPLYALAVTRTAELGDVVIPKGFGQAVKGMHASYWREAIEKELAGPYDSNGVPLRDESPA